MIVEELYYRLSELIPEDKNKKAILPFSRSFWEKGVREGTFPKPKKFGRISAWKGRDILKILGEN